MALAIAAMGWLAAAGPRPITQLPWLAWRIKLLKLYPFRIADLVVPFTLAVTTVRWLSLSIAGAISLRRGTFAAAAYTIAFIASLLWPGVDRNPSRMRPQVREDWIASLNWIRAETPRDSLLWMPDEDWAVKWFAERPEYVNFKDCPQDTAGIIEWYERRVRLAEWKRDAAADGHFSADELAMLHEQMGITHVAASRMGPVDLEPAYSNESFRVYDLRNRNVD
ncbi:MAG: hypothetical protein JNG89_08425 [Planctomycetaceae bacterium]|nr:hypothetical protein [Planctomycetaceae bacterium]